MKELHMVDLVSQAKPIKSEILSRIENIIDSARFIGGDEVNQLGERLSQKLSVKHVIPCGNGTDAIQIALMALGLKPGDEVICPSFTFVATAEVISLLNLKPIFVDVDLDSFNMILDGVDQVISDRTKAIIPVHLFGQMANMSEIMTFASKHDMFVVEDTAQCIGGSSKVDSNHQYAGTIGDIGTTSFFPSKNLGAYGDGGAIFTNSDDLAKKIRSIVNHGMTKRYYYDCVGVNSRLDSIQAAILNVKLKHFDDYIYNRQQAAKFYDLKLSDLSQLQTPKRTLHSDHVFHQYTIRILDGSRDALHEYLKKHDIPNMIYYPVPIHKQAPYLNEKVVNDSLTNTDLLTEQVLSLPMHTELDEDQLMFICNKIIEFYS